MTAIFLFSSANATDSDRESLDIVSFVIKLFKIDTSGMSVEELAEFISGLNHFIRKAAHFTEFAALGFAVIHFLDIAFDSPLVSPGSFDAGETFKKLFRRPTAASGKGKDKVRKDKGSSSDCKLSKGTTVAAAPALFSAKYTLLFSVLFSVLYAISDELHQYFSDGRAPGVKDVLIDSAGAIAGIAVTLLLRALFLAVYRKKHTVTPEL